MCADGRWSAEATGQMTVSPPVGRAAWWWRQQAGKALKRKDTTCLCKLGRLLTDEKPDSHWQKIAAAPSQDLWFSFPQHAAAHYRSGLVTDVLSHARCIATILSQGCTLINRWQKEQHITARRASVCRSITDKITWVQRYTLDPCAKAKRLKHPQTSKCNLLFPVWKIIVSNFHLTKYLVFFFSHSHQQLGQHKTWKHIKAKLRQHNSWVTYLKVFHFSVCQSGTHSCRPRILTTPQF